MDWRQYLSQFEPKLLTVLRQGYDAELIDSENAADNARADGLGLSYDSDARSRATSAPPNSNPNDEEPA